MWSHDQRGDREGKKENGVGSTRRREKNGQAHLLSQKGKEEEPLTLLIYRGRERRA